MKWFILRGKNILERDDIGEDADHILFKCDCNADDELRCGNEIHRVNKVYIGVSYFSNRKDAEMEISSRRLKGMNSIDIKRFALVLAVQAEIEGMKAENAERMSNGHALAYHDEAFSFKAEQIRGLAYKHDNEL